MNQASASERVAAAMEATPRTRHLTPAQHSHSHEDVALPLFAGQTNSQPSTVASMLILLDAPVGARVLDVGAGSGWTTAILAHLVGETGSVLGLELVPDLGSVGASPTGRSGRP